MVFLYSIFLFFSHFFSFVRIDKRYSDLNELRYYKSILQNGVGILSNRFKTNKSKELIILMDLYRTSLIFLVMNESSG